MAVVQEIAPIKIEKVNLQGERCSGIEQIAKTHTPAGLRTDVIILGEHRFSILTTGKPSPRPRPSDRLALVEKSTNSGELDVVGIDQALAIMENGSKRNTVQR